MGKRIQKVGLQAKRARFTKAFPSEQLRASGDRDLTYRHLGILQRADLNLQFMLST